MWLQIFSWPEMQTRQWKIWQILQKVYISRFHDNYTSLNKGQTLERSSVFSLDFKKNVSCVTQVVANKIFETGITQKIIADSGTTQYLIANWELICD